jgi:4-amino-4-deoxy-L-arabinose transferase-like glycosyltransferase
LLLLDELREAWRSESRDHRVALVSIAVIAINLRLLYVWQPMRYDEAVTYMHFVRHPWFEALSTYTYPNNHLFHTLLAKASVTVFGNSPWALRLPALLAGILLVPATYAVARALYGGRAALIAAAIVASSGVLVLYSTNARGYTIVALAFLLLVLSAIRLQRGAGTGEWIAFAVIAALGLWTIPVMLYPLGTVAVWLALSLFLDGKRAELRRLGLTLGAAGGIALLLYLPVISRAGLGAITRNKFVAPSGWYEFFSQLPASFGEALRSWSLGIPPLVSLVLLACALVALRYHATASRFRVNIALAAFVWSAWLLVVNHRAPFARVWLWFLPIAASLAAAGVVLLFERWPRTRRFIEQRTPALAVGLGLGAAMSIVLSFAVLLTRDTGTYRDAEEASIALGGVLQPGDRVLVGLPTNGPLEYYFDRIGVNPDHLQLPERSARRIFVVVDQVEGQTLERLIARSVVRDSAHFTPPTVIASFPASQILMYQRRDVPTK